MNNKEALMTRLQIIDFVLVDTALFLNTHPKCQEALKFYQKYLALRKETLQEYTRHYGPIAQDTMYCTTEWDWNNKPWPWHKQDCEV